MKMNETVFTVIFASVLLVATTARPGIFSAQAGGKLVHESPSIELRPSLFTPAWEHKGSEFDVSRLRTDGVYEFNMSPFGNREITGSARYTGESGTVRAAYTFEARASVTLNCLFVTADIQVSEFKGGTWKCAGSNGQFPDRYKELILMNADAKELILDAPDGRRITFVFPEETPVLIQDNRQWGESFSVRIGRLNRFDFKKGESLSISFSVSAGNGTELHLQKPITLAAGPDWIPLDAQLDIAEGSALDFSRMGSDNAPAGRHGRVVARGPNFEFAGLPGKSQRFYGVNFCFSALYPEKETAERVARRLSRIGYNTVRIHHYESMMTEGSADGTELNADAMRKFDFFMAELIKEGIYLSTDLFVSRRIPWRAVGIDKPGNIPQDTFKKLVPVHKGAYDNLKKFTAAFLTHVNPHTGRSYAAEPALAWINIINEGNFGNHYSEIKEIPEWSQTWQRWLAEKKRSEPELYKNVPDTIPSDVNMSKPDPHKAAFLLFFRDVEIEMITRFRKLLRDELGCEALISNANGWSHYLPDHFARSRTYDYIDEHFYVDHPHFIQRPWRLPSRCPNTNPVRNSSFGARPEIYMRHYDKPFTISEYNYSAPGRFRGVGGILTGTLAALQDWNGLWRFSYSHNINSLEAAEAPPLGYFDMLCDPLSLAAERASICLFLREDIKALSRKTVIHLPEERFNSPNEVYYSSKKLWPALGWSRKTGLQIGGGAPQGFEHSAAFPEVFEQYNSDQDVVAFIGGTIEDLVRENRAVRIDHQSGSFAITTERTCGGFCEEGVIEAGPLRAAVSGSAATIWISALDNLPLRGSKRILLTHLTDIQNSGIKYAEESLQTLLDWGGLPHIVRRGRAELQLSLDQPDALKVFALSTAGGRLFEIPCSIKDGRAFFNVDTSGRDGKAVILYEIVRGP